jgi:uncharacterized protein YukE
MQVDTTELRAAAAELRNVAAEQLRQAGATLDRAERAFNVEAAFDTYTTAAPYRATSSAWQKELEVLAEATRELADALERTAAAYDASDAGAGARLTTVPR